MSTEQPTTSTRRRRWLTGAIVGSAGVAVLVAPGIAAYHASFRDTFGPVECSGEPFRASASGNLVSPVTECPLSSEQVRLTVHGGYALQPDGSMRYIVDMFGLRDPMNQ